MLALIEVLKSMLTVWPPKNECGKYRSILSSEKSQNLNVAVDYFSRIADEVSAGHSEEPENGGPVLTDLLLELASMDGEAFRKTVIEATDRRPASARNHNQ
jgi:hypothetical protein